MNILLFSMPDSFEHMPTVAIAMPNGALASLAGNVDSHHRVAVADLILVQSEVRQTVVRLVKEFQPDVVGLSVMTFQRHTAQKIISLVRRLKPDVQVVVGGYDPSLDRTAYTHPSPGRPDFIVRGEGEQTFRELLRALENGRNYWPYVQHPTPYPGTPMTLDFRARNLIINEALEEYDGTTAVVKTEHLTAGEIEYLPWKAERWIKTQHFPAALRHSPKFVLRRGHKMLAHTFRGSSWKSMLGLETTRRVSERYRAIRKAERNYLPLEVPSGEDLRLPQESSPQLV